MEGYTKGARGRKAMNTYLPSCMYKPELELGLELGLEPESIPMHMSVTVSTNWDLNLKFGWVDVGAAGHWHIWPGWEVGGYVRAWVGL